MIHIHVPSYQTFSDPIDPFNKYTVYDIYVNGAYHASVRYKLLYELHEKILGIFGLRLNIPEFPPKKLWRLDSKALNFRRESLAKYLQSIFQIPDISRHPVIERNFLEYQIVLLACELHLFSILIKNFTPSPKVSFRSHLAPL